MLLNSRENRKFRARLLFACRRAILSEAFVLIFHCTNRMKCARFWVKCALFLKFVLPLNKFIVILHPNSKKKFLIIHIINIIWL